MNNEQLPKTRHEAQNLYLKFYFTGKPCKRGHIDKRRTSNGNCVKCDIVKMNDPDYYAIALNQHREFYVRSKTQDISMKRQYRKYDDPDKYIPIPEYKEVVRKRSAQYFEDNTQYVRQQHKQDYENKKEQYLARSLATYHREREANPVRWMLRNALSRAKRKGLPYDKIEEFKLEIPSHCPILGIKLIYANKVKKCDNSATLDRIIPSKGYTKDNVIIISWRANRIKCDSTFEELEKITEFYRKLNIAPLV